MDGYFLVLTPVSFVLIQSWDPPILSQSDEIDNDPDNDLTVLKQGDIL